MPPQGPAAGKGKLIAAAGLGCVALLVVAIIAIGMLFGGKSSSAAADHLPEGCDLVARIDFHGLLDVPAVEKHVVPALEEDAKKSEDAVTFAKVLLTAKLNPKKDIADIAVCVSGLDRATSGGEPDFVGVMGGKFDPKALIDAMAEHGKADKLSAPTERDGLRVIESKDSHPKLFFAQASDGAFLVATTFELLKKAAAADSSGYKLPSDHLAIVVPAEATKRLAKLAPSKQGFDFGSAGRAELTANFAPGKVAARADLGSAATATSTAAQLNAMVPMLKLGGQVPSEAKATVDGLKIEAKGNELIIEAPIAAETIEKVAKEMADGIKQADKEL